MRKLTKSKGFTIIELLLVLAIIGTLSAIIYSSFSSAQAGSRDKKRVADLSLLQVALEAYFNTNGQYPTSTLLVLAPNYIGAISTPPSGSPGGQNYQYNYYPLTTNSANTAICTSYQLWTTLETNSQYLSAKAGLDTVPADNNLPSGMSACNVSGSPLSVNASSTALVYDIVPR